MNIAYNMKMTCKFALKLRHGCIHSKQYIQFCYYLLYIGRWHAGVICKEITV